MGSEDRVEELYRKALELPLAERASFVAKASSDPAIRDRVLAKLDTHQDLPVTLSSDGFQSGTQKPNADQTVVQGPDQTSGGSADPEKSLGSAGPYRFLSVLGEGGMGTVYLAEQVEPVRRKVALKVIKSGRDTREVVARFEAERQALALMDHPGIAKVLDAGKTSAGLPYFAMELVQGQPITKFCDDHQISLNERLELFREVCLAVQHAHQKAVIHRDLKPSNILVASDDNGAPAPKIIDFGLAKALEAAEVSGPDLTLIGRVMGTPQYMSPEQADASQRNLDTRTDIYSLGATLYELVSGSPPLLPESLKHAGLAELLSLVRDAEPDIPSDRVSSSDTATIARLRGANPQSMQRSLRGELDQVVMKAIEKDPDRRYQTAAQMAEDIRCYLNDLPVSAAPLTWRYQAQKYVRRNRLLVSALCVVAVSVLVALVGVSVGLVRARIAESDAHDAEVAERVQRKLTFKALQKERAALVRSEATLSELYVARAEQAVEDGYPAQGAVWFANAGKLPKLPENRRQVHLLQASNAIKASVFPIANLQLEGNPNSLAFSPSGSYLAASTKSPTDVHVYDRNSFSRIELSSPSGVSTCCDWKDQSDVLAIGGEDGFVRVWDVSERQVIAEIDFGEKLHCVRFSRDGRLLACASARLRVWDLESGGFVSAARAGDSAITSIDWHRNGTGLLAGREDKRGIYLDLSKETEIQPQVLPHRPSNACSPIWDAAGDTAFAVEWDPKLRDFQLVKMAFVDGRLSERKRLNLNTENVYGLTASSDGAFIGIAAYLAFIRVDVGNDELKASRYAASNQVLDAEFIGGGGDLIAVGRNSHALVVRSSGGKEFQTHLPHFGMVTQCAANREGLLIATAHHDGNVTIWRDARIQLLRQKDENWGYGVSLSADGRFAAPTQWHEMSRFNGNLGLSGIRFLDLERRQLVRFGGLNKGQFVDAAISHDSTTAAIAYSVENRAFLQFFELPSGLPKTPSLPLKNGSIASIAYSANDRLAVLHDGGAVNVVNGKTAQHMWGKSLAPWTKPYSVSVKNHRVRFTPDGAKLIVVTPGNKSAVHVLDPENGEPIFEPILPVLDKYWCRSIEIARDGKILATAVNGKNAVRLWDLETGQEVGKPILLPGDFVGVFRVDFNADASQILTANFDGFVRQFDVKSGKPCGPSLPHPDEVFDARYFGEGRYACTACRDGFWRAWELATGEQITPAVKLGDGPEHGAPVTLAVNEKLQVCLATGDKGQLYQINLANLTTPLSSDLDTCLALGSISSGRALVFGSLDGLDLTRWRDLFNDQHKLLSNYVDATSINEANTIMREVYLARQRNDLPSELVLLGAVAAKLPGIEEADADALEHRAQVTQRALAVAQSINDLSSFEAWRRDAEELRSRLVDLQKMGSAISPRLAHETGAAWLRAKETSWTTLKPLRAAANSVQLTTRPNGRVDASGSADGREVYTCEFATIDSPVQVLRLSMFAGPEGGFRVTRIQVHAVRNEKSTQVPISGVGFSQSSGEVDVGKLVGPGTQNGWATIGYERADQWCELTLRDPVQDAQSIRVIVEMNCEGQADAVRGLEAAASGDRDYQLHRLLRDEKSRDVSCRNEALLAATHLLAGQPESAISLLASDSTEANQSQPAPLAMLLALAHLRNGNEDLAKQVVEQAITSPTSPLHPPGAKSIARFALQTVNKINASQAGELIRRYELRRNQLVLDALVHNSPADAYFINRRANWLKQQQMWKQALDDQLRIRELNPKERLNWLYPAPLIALGDPARYAQYVDEVRSHFAKTKVPQEIEITAKISCLLPGPQHLDQIDLDEVFRQMEAGKTPSYMPQYAYGARAMVSYRLGRFEQAIEWARKSREANAARNTKGQMLAITGLAHAALGNRKEALTQLRALDDLIARGVAIVAPQELGDAPQLSSEQISHDRLIVEIFRRELIERLSESEKE